jgi:hypothetical protein
MTADTRPRRFDQCTATCTADCGHCKGRPVEELRAELTKVRAENKAIQANRLVAAIFSHHPAAPRPFGLHRREDVSGVSGTGLVAVGLPTS